MIAAERETAKGRTGMTRIIKASEVKPGMTIRWMDEGFSHQGTVDRVTADHGGYITRFTSGIFTTGLRSVTPVTVLAEPQPEEPTEFGAKVRLHDRRFVRLSGKPDVRFHVWTEEGTGDRWSWDDLCEMGSVTVVPDQGWTVPAETPEVPERIEKWPEADEHLRKHKWRDVDGDTWTWVKAEDKWECRSRADIRMGASRRPGSWFGPFTRVTDA